MRIAKLAPAIALLLLAGARVSADWLVTNDGKRIETQGPWEVKGRQVLFTLPNGTLSVMRTDDIDLEASNEATARSREAARAPADSTPAEVRPERRKAVLVVTNESLGVGESSEEDTATDEDPTDPEEVEDPTAEPEAGENQTPAREPVEIVSWRAQDSASGDGIEIVGTVRNNGADIAAAIRVTIEISIPEAEEMSTFSTRAFLEKSALSPGSSTTFRTLLPGVFSLVSDPSFEVQSEAFSVQGPARSSSGDDEPDDEFAPEAEG